MSLKSITAFNMDLGECILLHFENKIGEKYFMLVDFGTMIQKSSDETLKAWQIIGAKIEMQLIEKVGQEIRSIVEQNDIDILISHFDKDHCNGIPIFVNSLKKPTKVFTSLEEREITKQIDSDDVVITKFPEGTKHIRLNEGNDFTLHLYNDGSSEKINILSSKNNANEDLNDNDMSLIFELEAGDNKWYLFTGDLEKELNLPHKYSFIKVPHHGRGDWIKSYAKDAECQMLITNYGSFFGEKQDSYYHKNFCDYSICYSENGRTLNVHV